MLTINFTPFPNLNTERLALRKLGINDSVLLSQLRSIESMNRYIARADSLSVEEAAKLIEKLNKGIATNDWIFWAVTLKQENKLIGTACLWNISAEDSRAELGYELHPEFQGIGLMHEAVSKVIEFGFTEMNLKIIEAVVNPDNAASIKLLQKFNFKRDGVAENRMGDDLKNYDVYSLTIPLR